MFCDGAFEGGGVRGIGFAGAIAGLEKRGYNFRNVAGCSAGAMIACLVAAGFSGSEMQEEIAKLNYLKFKNKGLIDYIPFAGKFLSILFNFGIYDADYFEMWLGKLLKSKGIVTFGDLKSKNPNEKYNGKNECCLQIIASDVTSKRLLILPRDLALFGINPAEYPVVKAARMSMSIPIFFEPFKLKDSAGKTHYIVDGGLLSNYPMWVLDNGVTPPPYPVFGFKFVSDPMRVNNIMTFKKERKKLYGIFSYLKDVISTTVGAGDFEYNYTAAGDSERVIRIDTIINIKNRQKNIDVTDFNIKTEEALALFNNGVIASERFLTSFNFEKWKRKFRDSK